MKPVLPLFVFIDACGWEIIRHDAFASEYAPFRRRLRSVFGYSSACIPSILSGRWPAEHRNWCYFVYDPARSPFRALRRLRWLPAAITGRRRVRRWLSKFIKRQLKFRGYFDLYNMPFRHISLFDFTEKKSPLQPGGMNHGSNLFDFLEERGIRYHVSEPTRTEDESLDAARQAIATEAIDFAFVYWPELDGLMHRVGNDAPEVDRKLRDYEQKLDRLLLGAREHYEQVQLYVFSDHGMANCDRHLDLRARIDELGLELGVDYAVVYDSTMARFWFLHDRAREAISAALREIPDGRILGDAELADLGTLFPDRYFGELIYLVDEGTLIVPSHMGERPIRAMHGFHPDAPHSYASLLTNQPEVPSGVTAIPDMYKLMARDAVRAHQANRRGEEPLLPAAAAARDGRAAPAGD